MKIKVGVTGHDQVGRRLTAAVAAQEDMALCPHLAGDVVVNCSDEPCRFDVPVIQGPGVRREEGPCFSLLADETAIRGRPSVQVASANALAFARLLSALKPLGPVRRFFASTFRRSGHATDPRSGWVDSLEPVFADPAEDWDLTMLFDGLIPQHHVNRTRGPYTHSDLHMLKIDLETPPRLPDVLAALKRGPRLMVGAARDGFGNTAQVQEFFRDLGGRAAVSYPAFVWEESVAVIDGSLVLLADVSPEITPIPEIIDAIRLNQRPGVSLAASVAQTDAALGVRTEWADWGRGR
jgi:glyceraldehyde-3-phosphate dehydrogenase (NAD(P))